MPTRGQEHRGDMKSATATIVLMLVGLIGMTTAQNPNPLHVYFESGDTMEQITDHGVTVTATLKEVGKENWLWVYISNNSNDAVNVFPASITVHQNLPKDEALRMKTERELQRGSGHRVFWGQVIAGVGAGLSRNISRATTKDAYGNSYTTTVNTPDYEAQARWLALADRQVQREQAITDFHRREWLRANTLFPGSAYAGRLIFVRDKKFASGFVRVSVDARNYEFPFPPPQSARPPDSAPALPSIGSVSTSAELSGMTTSAAPSGSAIEPGTIPTAAAQTAGVLGASGTNWEQGGVRGVEILGIAPDNAAEVSGLHTGDVITDVNGRKIRSTQDLASVLVQNGPGSRISVGYMFKSNLGWMPKETVVVLTK